MSYLISVIIPVFNGEKYIRQCLDSIVNQTLGVENIEVILVDDASTDNSIDIINEYLSRYPSFKLLKQESNQGSGPARNLGLKHVTSDYVTYLDCDDYISHDAYEKALEIFKSDSEIDLVMYKWEEFDENGLLNRSDIAKTSLKNHKIITEINDYPELIFATYVYIKVYHKRLFEFLDFPPRSYQDNIASARVMINANKIYISEDICCYYRQYPESISKEVSVRNYLNILTAAKQVIDLRDSSDEKYYNILSFLALKLTYHAVYYICKHKGFTLKEGEAVWSELKKYPEYFTVELLEEYDRLFPGYLPCSKEALWDIEKMNYYDYVIKYRCQSEFDLLKREKDNLQIKHTKLKNENKKLKKEIKKNKKLLNELLNSKSWRITAPLRKLKKKKPTIAIKTPNPKSEHHWGDYFLAISLKKSFEKKGFKVLIHEYEDWYKNDNVDIVFVLRGLYEYKPDKKHINLMWNISHPELVKPEEYEKYDIVFIASQKYAEKISKKVKTKVFPLLQCSDPEIFYPQKDPDLSHDILFVGISRNGRPVIDDILKTNHSFTVYGKHWDESIDKKYYGGVFIPNTELHKYYSSCKILLNDHWKEMREMDFPSNRLFDALLCETLVISDDIPSAGTVFKDSIVTYNGVEDLNAKINYYLENPQEREKLAKKGREIVLKNHTYDNRVEYILKHLKGYL